MQFATFLKAACNPDIIAQVVENHTGETAYTKYQADPVAFGVDVLGESYTDDIRVMMESVRDNRVTIAKSANAVGKTHSAARIAAWWYKCFPMSKVYTAAAPPESNLKDLLWGEINNIAYLHPDIFKADELTSLLIKPKMLPTVDGKPAHQIKGVTIPSSGTKKDREAKFSGKHAPYLLFIIDEGDAVPDEVYQGIESCMSGGVCRMLIMYNPRQVSGKVYQMDRDKLANIVELSAFRHPNVITGTEVIPGGTVDRETTVRRINQWCRPLANDEREGLDTFLLPDFLVGEIADGLNGIPYRPLVARLYKITNPAFSYMVLGRYPAQAENQLISLEWIEAAVHRWRAYVKKFGEVPPRESMGIMGLDCAEFGADANAAIFRYAYYIERPVTWAGVDIIATGDQANVHYKQRRLMAAAVDAIGIGAGVAPHMRRLGCNAHSVKVSESPRVQSLEFGQFGNLRDELWWACREWLRTDPRSTIPPDEDLIEDLQTPTYGIVNGKLKVMDKDTMRELIGRSPDKGDALCLTFDKRVLKMSVQGMPGYAASREIKEQPYAW